MSKAARFAGVTLSLAYLAIDWTIVDQWLSGDPDTPWYGAALISLMIIAGILGGLRLAFWPSLHLSTEDIVVRNPIRTVRLPLIDLVRCGTSRDGLVLTSITGDTVVAWALQKGIGLSVLGVRTRADRAEELIKATASRAWEDAGFIPPRTLRSRAR